jgi:hypothetical protein
MIDKHQLFERAARAFNTANIMKGQVVSIATCDPQGCPNVAPIGSMRVVDANTVHVLQGFLPRTLKNLESNPAAAFSITLRTSMLREIWGMLRKGPDAPIGYRLYGRLVEMSDDRALVHRETQEIVRRMPWFMRRTFAGFCEKNLRRLLSFEIVDIRATG